MKQQPQLPEKQYIQWFKAEEGKTLNHKKQIATITYEFVLRPAAFLAISRLDSSLRTADTIQAICKKKDSVICVLMKIRATDSKLDMLKYQATETDYNDRIHYFSSLVQNDLVLIQGEDTLRCVHHVYERTYGLVSDISIIAYFTKPHFWTCGEVTVQFDDKIFGGGRVKELFDAEYLEKVPTIKEVNN